MIYVIPVFLYIKRATPASQGRFFYRVPILSFTQVDLESPSVIATSTATDGVSWGKRKATPKNGRHPPPKKPAILVDGGRNTFSQKNGEILRCYIPPAPFKGGDARERAKKHCKMLV
jgi:hypothetical protein